MPQKINIFWFRRDLRLEDNAGLFHALDAGLPVLPVFIFDRDILDELEERSDARVSFIYHALEQMQERLVKLGSSLDVRYGHPLEIWKKLIKEYDINAVYANKDYEPYARGRDKEVKNILVKKSINFLLYKDQVVFEEAEVTKDDGLPYMVFTPYSRKWRALLQPEHCQPYKSKRNPAFLALAPKALPTLAFMGFTPAENFPTSPSIDEAIVQDYDKTRDIPSLPGTTHLGVHLRFGTVSIRKLVARAVELNPIFLGELIWREFFMQMLWHRPDVVGEPCKKEYAHIRWRNNEKEFERWCEGNTGYPLVDAGMRELNATGFMHNRVRMVTASFLVKHLLIDWRWGEAYFAKKLLDYELSSNNGNWQWVAGCGCDAAPYFRIFNPAAQTKRFDPQLKYIKKWIPELDGLSYPEPMVDHELARARCLKVYKEALQRK
jgi:deoxyribodipyrimidine photo-lyase